jgi:tetratricopeptide (TPR) repeat protein
MSDRGDALEFINRETELAFLRGCFEEAGRSAFVVIRAPPGIGKSRLTDQFAVLYEQEVGPICAVEPEINDAPVLPRLYAGYFLQRCAEALSRKAEENEALWPSFKKFLSSRRWVAVREKSVFDLIERPPNPENLYEHAYDYLARMFGFGRYRAHELLGSDQRHAVEVCAAYVAQTVDAHDLCLVIRDAQLADLYSLRQLLSWGARNNSPSLIIEYTTESGAFEPVHQKAFLTAAELRRDFSIINLLKLGRDHLEILIQQKVDSAINLDAQAHITWNGNLNSVLEINYLVSLGATHALPEAVRGVLADLTESLREHLLGLPSTERLALALCYAHVEALPRSILLRAVQAIGGPTQPGALLAATVALEEEHGFLSVENSTLRIRNETVAQVVGQTDELRGLIALGERALRDCYQRILADRDYAATGMPAALRQLFRLSSRTADMHGLLAACDGLEMEVRGANDQTVYVDAVASALEAHKDLAGADYDELAAWAGSLAYETADYERAARLFASRERQDNFSRAVQGFAWQEVGEHAESLQLAGLISADAHHSDERLVARLIEAGVRGSRGEAAATRGILTNLLSDPEHQSSPLLGYAFRLFEIVDDYQASLTRLQASVAWFGHFRFGRARAYSELPCAVLLARMGRIRQARQMISRAAKVLADQIRDQHLILNNRAAVELLSASPNYENCIVDLERALSSARDDFSEVTILTNLVIAHARAGHPMDAERLARHAMSILSAHDFVDTDTYWPVCFNAAKAFRLSGNQAAEKEARNFPETNGRPPSVNEGYWAYRYGKSPEPPRELAHLASQEFHPLYLSHWFVEMEGLKLLKRARLQ